jgi:hypothetical protein
MTGAEACMPFRCDGRRRLFWTNYYTFFCENIFSSNKSTTWGTTLSVNLNSNGEITKGGFWEGEENGIRFN